MTLRSLSRWLIGIPLLLVMILFGLSNTDPVRLGLFPLGHFPVQFPTSVVVLASLAIGYFLGGLRVRIAELRHRRAARRAEEAVRLLEAKHQQIRLPPGAGAASRV